MEQPELAIGPANYACQAHEWSKAVTRSGIARAWSFSHEPLRRGGFSFEVDRMIGRYEYRNPVLRGARARRFFGSATHIALDGFKPFFHAIQRGKFPSDVEQLVRRGYQVALISHGSDTRSPEMHREWERWSYFNEASDEWVAAMSANSAAARRFAQDSGLPVFYSTPDLGHYLTMGTWLPLTVELERWRTDAPVLERPVPRVLHLPSRRIPPIKGTQYIEPVLQELHDRGVIEKVDVTRVPHARMPELIKSVDIVVDQLLGGFYGVAAIEAMAAGRVTISRFSEGVKELMPEAPEIVDADPDSLRDVLLDVVENRDDHRRRVQHNLAFVGTWHDGRAAAERLAPFLGNS